MIQFTSGNESIPKNACIFNNHKALRGCSQEKERYPDYLMICNNHLKYFFNLAHVIFDEMYFLSGNTHKRIKLVLTSQKKSIIPIPIGLNENNQICIKQDTVYSNSGVNLLDTMPGIMSNGETFVPDLPNLNTILKIIASPQYQYKHMIQDRWKNIYVMAQNTKDNGEVDYFYLKGLDLPIMYRAIFGTVDMSKHYVLKPGHSLEKFNIDDNNEEICQAINITQPNLIIDLNKQYFELINVNALNNFTILLPECTNATGLVLAGVEVFDSNYNRNNKIQSTAFHYQNTSNAYCVI